MTWPERCEVPGCNEPAAVDITFEPLPLSDGVEPHTESLCEAHATLFLRSPKPGAASPRFAC